MSKIEPSRDVSSLFVKLGRIKLHTAESRVAAKHASQHSGIWRGAVAVMPINHE
jgi:hypothetical protein